MCNSGRREAKAMEQATVCFSNKQKNTPVDGVGWWKRERCGGGTSN